jgi:hypothetical protein
MHSLDDMGKMIKKALVALSIFSLLSCAWVFRPDHKPNMTEVIPELSGMKEPFKRIHSVYYLDGGTVGIQLIDQQDNEISFSLPAPLGGNDRYKELFKGALHYNEEGSQEISNPQETKARLAQILRSNPNFNQETDIALASMTGRLRDYLKIFYRLHITNSYENESYQVGGAQ